MSDFPRGWTLSNRAGVGNTPSITVPAIVGVVHVLDAFTFSAIANGSAAPLDELLTLSSSDGVFASFPLAEFLLQSGQTSTGSSGSGLDLAAGPGSSLTIAGNAAAIAGTVCLLVIQGHDI